MGVSPFDEHLASAKLPVLRRERLHTLQLNIGLECDLACHHCHVESGPKRTEAMDRKGAERVLELLARSPGVGLLDITGGAPELNAQFRYVVEGARSLGRRVIDRCNLTVFGVPGQETTPGFLADQGVEIVASLPCYTRENVERQRGKGVFGRSVASLLRLNELGYGQPDGHLSLDLVYNPPGGVLPPEQGELEARYRNELRELFGIRFNRLRTLTNMPIKRFARDLQRQGRYDEYMSLLVNHFNADTLPGLMCRTLLSVSHDGRIFDCDFNQALDLAPPGGPSTIWQVDDLAVLEGAPIATGAHCFGCTAGPGSSCGGAIL